MKKFWFALFIFIYVASWADVVLERKTSLNLTNTIGKIRKLVRKEVLTIKGQNFKIEDKTFGDVLIVRSDKKVVWKIDTLRNTYSELPFEKIEEMHKNLIAELKQAKAVVEGSEEEKQIEKRLSDLGDLSPDAQIKVESLPDTEVVAGVKCSRKKIWVGGRVMADGFFADTISEGMNYFKSLNNAGAFQKEVTNELVNLKATMLKGDMRYTLFFDRVLETFETTSISHNEVSPEEFELPKGLKEVPLIGFEKAESDKKEALVLDGSSDDEDDEIKVKQMQ